MAGHRRSASVRDASMRAHDAFAIPLPHLRRRRSSGHGGGSAGGGPFGSADVDPGALGPEEHVAGAAGALTASVLGPSMAVPAAVNAGAAGVEDIAVVIARLVADRSPAALLRLRALLAERPADAPTAVGVLRRALLGKNMSSPDAAVDAVQFLMETSPYFYRYVANDKFFDALWKLASVDEFRARILGLIRDWALALKVQFPRRDADPAATFWKDKYDVLYKSIIFPEPTVVVGRNAYSAVCPTSLSDRRWHPLPTVPVALVLRTRETENSSASSGGSAELANNAPLEALLPAPLWRSQRRVARRASCASAEEAKAGGCRRLLPSRPHKKHGKEARSTERRSYEAVSRMLESMSPISDDDGAATKPSGGEASSALCRDIIHPIGRNTSASSASGSSVAAIARGRARERLAQSEGVDVGEAVGPLHGGRKNSDGPLAKLLRGPDGRDGVSRTEVRPAVDSSDLAFEADGHDDYVPHEPSEFSLYAGASEPETELGNSL
jgi:hypothetical protein